MSEAELLQRIEGWRRQRADLPNQSEAIRRLLVIGLDYSDGLAQFETEPRSRS